jgi:cobyrinic acid a,c-diamide synthase
LADPRGFIIAAPRSGSGKTLVTLGLIAALRRRGLSIAPAKTGPDYIDLAFHARVAGAPGINLDPWAMSPARLNGLVARHAAGRDLLVIEGVMGLFDGASDGTGSTADLAETLGLPVIFVIDADRQNQSVAALVHGFATWRPGVTIAGIILNRVASPRHGDMLVHALGPTGIPVLGQIPRDPGLAIPERHLGLTLPGEVEKFAEIATHASQVVEKAGIADHVLARSAPLSVTDYVNDLLPIGQHIAIAHDSAFAFIYAHLINDWHAAGATITPFSPLADEAPSSAADAVFLPGGYPELHGPTLSNATRFHAGLHAARDRGALIYGECGGYMVLGRSLTDRDGITYPMAGLLPVDTRIDRPTRRLGYRRLTHASPLPWPARLRGHEFHYSSAQHPAGTSLFAATDAIGTALEPMGLVDGRVMGSYAHIIDADRD